ncbi:hypothetical protein L810_2588 [Burkholderia sp. AU4i]|nr:hypothetical protein L810_2588 [Burkholderia sp. AU4i]
MIPHSRISTGIAKPINWPSKPSSTIASAASSSAPARSTRGPCTKSSPCARSPRSGAATASCRSRPASCSRNSSR